MSGRSVHSRIKPDSFDSKPLTNKYGERSKAARAVLKTPDIAENTTKGAVRLSVVVLILKIILYIILAVLGLIVVVLCLPVGAEVGFVDKKLTYKVRYWFLNVFSSDKKGILQRLKNRKKKPKKRKKRPPENAPAEDDFDLPEVEDIPDESELPEETPVTADEDTAAGTADDTVGSVPDEPAADEPETEDPDADVLETIDPDHGPENSGDEELFCGGDDEPEEKKSGRSASDTLELVFGLLEAVDRPLLKIFKGFKFSEVYIDFIIANEDAYKCALNYGRISGAIYNILGWLGVLCTVKYKTVDINPGFAQKNSRWDISLRLSFRPITVIAAGLLFLFTYVFRVFIPEKLKKRKLKKLNAARQK